jgi:hypothetical protein
VVIKLLVENCWHDASWIAWAAWRVSHDEGNAAIRSHEGLLRLRRYNYFSFHVFPMETSSSSSIGAAVASHLRPGKEKQ